jgi:SWI/SNF-related matrix-associated actin-dependent regulator of chromatin subfamily B protein 1
MMGGAQGGMMGGPMNMVGGAGGNMMGAAGGGMMGPPGLPRHMSGTDQPQQHHLPTQQMNGYPRTPQVNGNLVPNANPLMQVGLGAGAGTPQRPATFPLRQTSSSGNLHPGGALPQKGVEQSAMGSMGLKFGGAGPLGHIDPTASLAPPPIPSIATSTPGTSKQPTSQSSSTLPPVNHSLNVSVTETTSVPLIHSLKLIPELDEKDIANMQEWMKVDKEYEGRYVKMKDRMHEELKAQGTPAKAAWWERDSAEAWVNVGRKRGREVFDVKYPKHRRDGRRRAGKREGLRL